MPAFYLVALFSKFMKFVNKSSTYQARGCDIGMVNAERLGGKNLAPARLSRRCPDALRVSAHAKAVYPVPDSWDKIGNRPKMPIVILHGNTHC